MPDNDSAFRIREVGAGGKTLAEGFFEAPVAASEPGRPALVYRQVQHWLSYELASENFFLEPYPAAPWDSEAEWQQYVAQQRPLRASTYVLCLAEVYAYERRADGTFLPESLPEPRFPAAQALPGARGIAAAIVAPVAGDLRPRPDRQMDIGFYQSAGGGAGLTAGKQVRQVDPNLVRVVPYAPPPTRKGGPEEQVRTVEYWVTPDVDDFASSPALDYRPGFLMSFPERVNSYPWVTDRLYLSVIGCISF